MNESDPRFGQAHQAAVFAIDAAIAEFERVTDRRVDAVDLWRLDVTTIDSPGKMFTRGLNLVYTQEGDR